MLAALKGFTSSGRKELFEQALLEGNSTSIRDWLAKDRTLLTEANRAGYLERVLALGHSHLIEIFLTEDEIARLPDINAAAAPANAGAGAPVEEENRFKRTALHVAVAKDDREAIIRIMDADPSKRVELLQAVDLLGFAPLHLAVDSGESATVIMLLDYGARQDRQDSFGRQPLTIALMRERFDLAAEMLERGAPVNTSPDGLNPIHVAAWHGRADVVTCLVRKGALLNPKQKMRQGLATLFRSAGSIVEYTPSNHAIESGHLQVVQVLVAAGASLDTPCGPALNCAVEAGYTDVIDYLSRVSGGALLKVANADGRDALAIAAMMAKQEPTEHRINILLDLVERLLASGEDIKILRAYGEPLLNVAAEIYDLRLINRLLELGADPNLEYRGDTALHVALKREGSPEQKLAVAQALIRAGVNVNARDAEGHTALHLAARQAHNELIRELLKAGANPRLPTPGRIMPFDLLVFVNYADLRRRTACAYLLLMATANHGEYCPPEGFLARTWRRNVTVGESTVMVRMEGDIEPREHRFEPSPLYLATEFRQNEELVVRCREGAERVRAEHELVLVEPQRRLDEAASEQARAEAATAIQALNTALEESLAAVTFNPKILDLLALAAAIQNPWSRRRGPVMACVFADPLLEAKVLDTSITSAPA